MFSSHSDSIQNLDTLKSAGFQVHQAKTSHQNLKAAPSAKQEKTKKVMTKWRQAFKLAHLDAFHCHRGFCYNTSSHLSFGGKYKQNLQTTALLSCVHEKQF